ncbi:MAG: UDP-N-acetylmuramoyl-tripeptide--D-alanyl-D-alanine ligase [Thermoflexales bacterium]|nr:UDP-N-acetylmuramoyl-tripeptide--D-alanyl-D-alanine ligase [Thermoflexales bacterium]
MKLAELFEILYSQAMAEAEQPIHRVVIDSRQAEPGDLFVALPGEKSDGHDFVADAFARGAVAALVHRDVQADCAHVDLRAGGLPLQAGAMSLPVCMRVDDTLAALQRLAGAWRARFDHLRVIGITGSVGKSSTKELAWTVLARKFNTYKNKGNLNNEIGLPLSLLELSGEHERAVLEMGMYATGEIALLCELARPAVGVVTNVGPAHLSRLGSLKAITQAKAELVEALPAAPEGVAILNDDDPVVRQMASKTRARVLSYGLDSRADLWADQIESQGLEGITFRLHYQDETLHVRVPLLGRHSVHTSLRAAAIGIAEGLSWDHILAGLQDRRAALRLVAVPGPGGSIILDDTYNASPASTIAALNLLDDMRGRKIAVLGDMLELGNYEAAGHRKVGRRAMEVADALVTVGALGRLIGEEALACGMPGDSVWICESNEEAAERLKDLITAGDFVLVKGSRGMQMDAIVSALCAEDQDNA